MANKKWLISFFYYSLSAIFWYILFNYYRKMYTIYLIYVCIGIIRYLQFVYTHILWSQKWTWYKHYKHQQNNLKRQISFYLVLVSTCTAYSCKMLLGNIKSLIMLCNKRIYHCSTSTNKKHIRISMTVKNSLPNDSCCLSNLKECDHKTNDKSFSNFQKK